MQLAACVSGGGGNDAPDVLVDEAAAAGLNVRHAAPEVLREARFSHKSDLWAAGVLVWQTLANGMLILVLVQSLLAPHLRLLYSYILEKPPWCAEVIKSRSFLSAGLSKMLITYIMQMRSKENVKSRGINKLATEPNAGTTWVKCRARTNVALVI